MVNELDVDPNIRRADVGEHGAGSSASSTGTPTTVDRALEWLRDEGVQVDLLGDVIES